MKNKTRIMCSYCEHWGGNNQKPVGSTGSSRCAIYKKASYGFQHCTSNFKELILRKEK